MRRCAGGGHFFGECVGWGCICLSSIKNRYIKFNLFIIDKGRGVVGIGKLVGGIGRRIFYKAKRVRRDKSSIWEGVTGNKKRYGTSEAERMTIERNAKITCMLG